MPTRARDLIESTLGGTPYLARALELLDLAERQNSDESCAVWTEHEGAVTSLALVGMVAGDAPRLVARACDVLRAMGARFAIAEWPDDIPFREALRRLREEGFAQEARIPDYFRAGVDQVFMRRNL